MKQVKYIGCSDSQVKFGNNSDPRNYLKEGQIYVVAEEHMHSWHTKYFLEGFEVLGFNSVCFEEV